MYRLRFHFIQSTQLQFSLNTFTRTTLHLHLQKVHHKLSMAISYRDGISMGQITVYSPGLLVAIFLAARHGFGKSSGWLFLIIFCLARLIGPAMQLATISDPKNSDLYVGYAVLNNVGVSPLIMAALGFLSRLLDNIHKTHRTGLSPHILRLVQLLVLVGTILAIVGGIDAGSDYVTSLNKGVGHFQLGTLSKVGVALLIISYATTVAFTILISFSVPHAEAGEKRVFLAVVATLPFLLVRLIYSCIAAFATNPNFNLITGSTTTLLCMCYIMELIMVIIYEVMGLTLRKAIRREPVVATRHRQIGSSSSSEPFQSKGENTAIKIFRRTIIGRLFMSATSNDENFEKRDLEMRSHRVAK